MTFDRTHDIRSYSYVIGSHPMPLDRTHDIRSYSYVIGS